VAPLIAWLIVLVTIVLAALFARQQLRTLRTLPANPDCPPEDRTYLRRQAYRRLAGCVLMVAIAGMMSAWYLNGYDAGIDAIGAARDAQKAAGDTRLRPEHESAGRFFVYYVNTMLLLILALLIITAFDVLAIRRFAVRHSRAIREDRRAMLERELAALRREKRGPRGDPSMN
jgi:amino acid transporter